MVSCKDLYDICEQLCNAFNLPTDAFAGKSMILAGDFAQLLPPGIGQSALYNSSVSLAANTSRNYELQKAALGRALWHSFTTVVILRQNMRQTGVNDDDCRFRVALENMRYGACTLDDIALLRSRIAGTTTGAPNLNEPGFHDVPIIVPWNTHRDTINDIAAARFAHERGVELHRFYSVDRLTSVQARDSLLRAARVSDGRLTGSMRGGLTGQLQQILWDLPPAVPHQIGLAHKQYQESTNSYSTDKQ